MRIDNYANILASAKTNVGDLMSRLNPGDVIRAKVIEITSDEAVLKLFDGTVMRAGMLEAMNAKAGDTVMLAVSSKNEGTLYLESVKNLSRMIESNPETLKQLLETLQIKPDAQNLGLAAELLKAGAPVTAEHLKQAAALLSSKPALDSEKAVFMTLKGLNADRADVELLSRLLEGDVKLGQQLKEVQALLDQANASGSDKANAAQANPTSAEQANSNGVNQANTPQTNATQADAAGSNQANSSQANTGGPAQTSAAQANSTETNQTNAAHVSATGANQANATGAETNPVELSTHIQSADIRSDQAAIPAANHSAAPNTGQASIPLFDPSVIAQNLPGGDSHPSTVVFAASRENAVSGMTPEHSAALQQPMEPSASVQTILSGQKINETKQPEGSAVERFSKLIEAVRDIFVKTDSEKLSSELDVNKINNELNEKLELLKAAIKISEDLGSGAREGLTAAATQIEDTQRLLHQMNSNNIHYYQMPVNLAGHDTTAELYVMNRRQNKKKIDPNDAVMFISLDTVNMGRVETLVDIKNNNVTVNLRTESKQINDFIKTQIKDLYTGLATCGYKLAGVRYAIIDAATTPIQQERLLNGIARENYGKVDYRI